jgi:hypothetical protein
MEFSGSNNPKAPYHDRAPLSRHLGIDAGQSGEEILDKHLKR